MFFAARIIWPQYKLLVSETCPSRRRGFLHGFFGSILASDEYRMVTGLVLPVDGGVTRFATDSALEGAVCCELVSEMERKVRFLGCRGENGPFSPDGRPS